MRNISWKTSATFGVNFPIRKWKAFSGPKGESKAMWACSTSVDTELSGFTPKVSSLR